MVYARSFFGTPHLKCEILIFQILNLNDLIGHATAGKEADTRLTMLRDVIIHSATTAAAEII